MGRQEKHYRFLEYEISGQPRDREFKRSRGILILLEDRVELPPHVRVEVGCPFLAHFKIHFQREVSLRRVDSFRAALDVGHNLLRIMAPLCDYAGAEL